MSAEQPSQPHPPGSPGAPTPAPRTCVARVSFERPAGFELVQLELKVRHVVITLEKGPGAGGSAQRDGASRGASGHGAAVPGVSGAGAGVPGVSGPDAPAAALDAAWQNKLEEIRALVKKRDWSGDTRGEIFEQRALIPGRLLAVRYCAQPTAALQRWLGLLATASSLVWLHVETAPENQELALGMLYQVASAWRTRAPDAPFPLPGQDAFYAVEAAISLPPENMERLRGIWHNRTADRRLTISYDYPPEKDSPGLLERLSSLLSELGQSLSSDLERVRSGSRKVAGFGGEEVVVCHEEHGGRMLNASWLYTGQRAPTLIGELRIELEAPDTQRVSALALWDKLLNGMRSTRP